jgi:hypothetical protein
MPSISSEPFCRCGDGFGKAAKARNQRLGQRFDVTPRHDPEEHQFHQLIIRQCFRPCFEEAGPQAIAVSMIVRLG